MCLSDIVIIICLIIVFVNQLYMCIYTRFERFICNRKKKCVAQKKSVDTEVKKTPHKKIIYAIYRFFESFSYGLMRYNLICTGKIPSYAVRRFFYRWVYCMDITKNTVIHGGCEFRSPWNIHADRCIIAVGCILDGRNGITIGQDVVFGSNVHIWTAEHNLNDSYFRVLPENELPVTIGAHAWICSDSTILPGCSIGEGAVVAARACVVKDCEAFGVYAGIPAKKIKERNRNLVYKTPRIPGWFFY